jgi:hypothetical protein
VKIEPTGIVLVDSCSIQTEKCVARKPAPITAVWTLPGRVQVNVCRPCLEEQVRCGEWEIQGARIKRRVDIAVYSPDRKLQLVVEVKGKSIGKNRARATHIRRNLLAHSGIPRTPYFLLAIIPDRLYLWKDSDTTNPDKDPDYEIGAREVLKPYLDKLPSNSTSSEYQFEVVLSSWLKDLVKSKRSEDPSLEWLFGSGLFETIRNGSVEMQAAVAA